MSQTVVVLGCIGCTGLRSLLETTTEFVTKSVPFMYSFRNIFSERNILLVGNCEQVGRYLNR